MKDPADALVSELTDELEAMCRRIAREELASFSGLMLRRLQDLGPTRSPQRNMVVSMLNELFGEALRDFSSQTAEPGT